MCILQGMSAMLDNTILAIIIPAIRTQLASLISNNGYELPPVQVAKNYQPTQQGAPSAPVVLIHKLFDKLLGSPAKTDVWDDQSDTMVHTEVQQMETTYQITALYPQTTSTKITASDLASMCSTILQSDYMIAFLQNNNLGIYKISEIRNVFFQDEKDRQESAPSFDFTLTHKNTTITNSPTASTIEAGIYQV